jgi:coenzyme F420-0:L-glutamate ligase/coenzyme F420-1:gamma-L-glutamate ligase
LTLTLISLPRIPLIKPGDDLVRVILTSLERTGLTFQDGDILVIAQKIVSKSEGRLVDLKTVTPSTQAVELAERSEKDPRIVELILRESKSVLRSRPGTIIVEHHLGFVCANAGIDQSNVNQENDGDWVLLLPLNPDETAANIRRRLEKISDARLGVLIIDSHGRAWRLGTAGVAIGLSGLPGLVDLRGEKDLFGYQLRISEVGAADELASAASLLMGQAAESKPVILVRGFPYPLREGNLNELIRPKEQDLFR